MPEKETELEVVQIDYICDECGEGIMKPDGGINALINQAIFMVGEITFDHKCSECGNIKKFKTKYPKLIHRPKKEKN